MAENIILCGLPGVGKTETGKAIAELLIWDFIDTDDYLEEYYLKSIGEELTRREIFKKLGDYGYRKLENEILCELASIEQKVIAIGGGTLTSEANKALVKSLGTVVYLKNEHKLIYERLIKRGGVPAYLNPENPFESFKSIAEAREPIYEENADIIIVTGDLSAIEIASQISKILLEQKS